MVANANTAHDANAGQLCPVLAWDKKAVDGIYPVRLPGEIVVQEEIQDRNLIRGGEHDAVLYLHLGTGA